MISPLIGQTLTGKLMHVNELYFLMKYKNSLCERKTKVLFDWLIYNRPRPRVISKHDGKLKHACAIEFDSKNLQAML